MCRPALPSLDDASLATPFRWTFDRRRAAVLWLSNGSVLLDLYRCLGIGSPDMSNLPHLHQMDAVDWLRTLPPASVDLVVTDPPYESLEKHRAVGTTTRLKQSKSSSNPWFRIFPNARFPELFAEIFRVLVRDSHF